MTQAVAEKLAVDVVDGHCFVFVPAGQGEELRRHLVELGIQPVTQRAESVAFDRLELGSGVDPNEVQAALGTWAN